METIILGADHAGFRLKEAVAEHLRAKGYEIEDIGCYSEESVDYPSISYTLAQRMQEKGAGVKGILCCGSGVGVSIAANRYPHIRAVLSHDLFTAQMSRRHNDANVLCMGGRIIAPALACEIADAWLSTAFEGGRHQKRVDLMTNVPLMKNGEEVSC